ncbi:uncharacterized protein LOC101239215 [Hydra vulgaris]|uniref:Uncharacterized protein LOC101239215 n=1 Tax=Hydra vulgaris TaxID=6087 RepID=A0ABM4CI74_HYDVU
MFFTPILLAAGRAGWRPRSLGVPGKQWIGKNRRVRHESSGMRKTKRNLELRIAGVESMIAFPYLTREEAAMPEKLEQQIADQKRRIWQKRHLGPDVFGLGLGKPSVLDHLMVSDTRRYNGKNQK